jgi:heme exporter protein B
MHHRLDLYDEVAIQCRGRIFIDVYLFRTIYNNTKMSVMRMLGSTIFLQQVWALLAKDLKTEWRTREMFTAMFVFAVLVVVVFNFAIGADPELIRQMASGVIWIALSFASVLGVQRTGQLERDEESLQGVLLALHDRSALFVAKMLAQMLSLLVVVFCTLPLCGIWFRIDLTACFGALCVAFPLGMLGLSIVGTLFGMIAVQTRASEVMLPLLFLPVAIPVTIAAVQATAQLIDGKSLKDIADYLVLLGTFDVVFLLWASYIVEE